MRRVQYLAYGSNLLAKRLRGRVGDIEALGVVRLPDWALSFTKRGSDGSGKCMIAPVVGNAAWGVVFSLPVAARAELDRIEGVGNGYVGATIEVAAYGPCYVYLAEDSHVDSSLSPFDWYKALVTAGAREHAFPKVYIDALEVVVAVADTDIRRREKNLRDLDE